MHVFVEPSGQLLAGSIDPAFHGADRAAELFGGIVIGTALDDDIFEHHPVMLGQEIAGRRQLLCPDGPFLRRRGDTIAGDAFLVSGRLPLRNPELRAERIAHDREQPGFQSGAAIELVEIGQRFRQRFLDKVIGIVGVSVEGPRKSAKGRNEVHYFGLQTG